MSDDENHSSDVSLDEEDEELIWRVFYGDLEKRQRSNNPGIPLSDDEPAGLDDSISDVSDVDDPELVAKYKELKSTQRGKKRDSNGNVYSHTTIEPEELPDEEKKRLLIASFTENQMDRFELYRRMRVNKPGVKRVCSSVLGHLVGQTMLIVLAGLLKLFLGEIITRAYEVQEKDFKARLINDIDAKKKQKQQALKDMSAGKPVAVDSTRLQYLGDREVPLQPEHIREAYRLYRLENSGNLNDKWRGEGDGDGKFFR